MNPGAGPQQATINIAPLIDVLLVLLIIFMVISPDKSVGLKTLTPQATPDDSAVPPPMQVVIDVKPDGVLELNRTRLSLADLAARLESIFHHSPTSTVFITGDPQLEYGEVARVIDIAKGAGIAGVGGRIGVIATARY